MLLDFARAVKWRMIFYRQWRESAAVLKERFFPGGARPVVLSGPFKGMVYLHEPVFGPLMNRWLGSYEEEIAPAVEACGEQGYAQIIDIGSAEGYYAVGLARSSPKSEVLAYDTDFISRWQCRRMGKLNGVKNLSVRGFCDLATFPEKGDGRRLVICDIEGFEEVVLEPEKHPMLKTTDVLVEVHEAPGEQEGRRLEKLLLARFGQTHEATLYQERSREAWLEANQGLWSGRLSDSEALESVNERRPKNQHWLFFKARG